MRPIWGAGALAAGLPRAVASWSHDVTLLQREFLSTLVTLEPLTRRPRVLDVDDAIFLYRGGRAARRLAKLSDAVICGNAFLAEWFGRWNHRITIVPTGVDTEHFVPRAADSRSETLVIGWIGTSSNSAYLKAIEPALRSVLREAPNAILRLVSDARPELPLLPADRVQFLRWSEASELTDIQGMDIGIMPLEDSTWARGKCSFKMLQYMSCAMPVVVSPVGMNAEVLRMGACGIGASGDPSWIDALVGLLRDGTERARLGSEGRRIAESSFSLQVLAPRIARAIGGV